LKKAKKKKFELKSLLKLQILDLSEYNLLEEISLDGLDNLIYLNLSFSKIKKLKLNSMPKLEKINSSGC
jgi:Leucine-rich repeat (LRR) protein